MVFFHKCLQVLVTRMTLENCLQKSWSLLSKFEFKKRKANHIAESNYGGYCRRCRQPHSLLANPVDKYNLQCILYKFLPHYTGIVVGIWSSNKASKKQGRPQASLRERLKNGQLGKCQSLLLNLILPHHFWIVLKMSEYCYYLFLKVLPQAIFPSIQF